MSFKISRPFKAAVAAILLAAIWIFGAWGLAEWLIVREPLEKADAIVVLGGSAVYLERVDKAAELFKAGISSQILLTDDGERGGWSKTEKRNPYFVELARKELVAQGVPPENIAILSPPVDGTRDEAILLGKHIQEKGLNSILIVTSAYHSGRALWLFNRYAKTENVEIGVDSPPPGLQTPQPYSWWLYRKGWSFVAGEYVKLAYYALF